MLCHLYSFASVVMLSAFGSPLVSSFTTISSDIDLSVDNATTDRNHTSVVTQTHAFDVSNTTNTTSADARNASLADGETFHSASSAQQLTWVKSTDGNHLSVKPDPNRNSSQLMKSLFRVFQKESDNREDSDLGLPPDIANEYIDAVNPPKFRIPVHYGHHYITSSVTPSNNPSHENRIHAGSSVVKMKANFTSLKTSEDTSQSPQNSKSLDLATLLKAELDVKKDELDQNKVYTPAPNLFALLPGAGMKTDNPFEESNYKSPNRMKASTHRPYVTSPESVAKPVSTPANVGQFVYSDGRQSIRVNLPANRPTIAVTTPNSISLISTSSATKMVVLKSTSTARPVHYTKMKIKSMSTSSTTSTSKTTPSPATTSRTPGMVIAVMSTITSKNTNKSNDWSSRVGNQTSDRSSESIDSTNSINGLNGLRESSGVVTHDTYVKDNVILRSNRRKKPLSDESYSSTDSTANRTDYADIDYDNSAVNPNYTMPDGFADYPSANYRLTTERLAYILIGSCCALSILCLIVVAMSVRCRDMCDEYRSWKKAEKAALRWQRHQYRMAHHRPDLSRYFRTSVEPNAEASARPSANVMTAPTPLYGPTCCHCLSCSSSWLFRDANKANRDWCCQRGYYHNTNRGKLPFGAASSVNTFMPRYANNSNSNNNCCDEQEGDTDSLNTSELLDTHHNRAQHHFADCAAANTRTAQTNHRQLRRIAQPNSNQNWIHSSEMVDELHKKHSNINNVSRDQTNINNFRARNRQIGNENIVVWNNNNDERLI